MNIGRIHLSIELSHTRYRYSKTACVPPLIITATPWPWARLVGPAALSQSSAIPSK